MGTSDRAARLQMTLLRTEATGKSMASPFFALELPRWCFSGGSDGKEHTCNTGDPGSSPGLGRSPGEGTGYPLQYSWASLVAQKVKDPSAMQKIWIPSLGWEDPLEEDMTIHSNILAWRNPMDRGS